MNTSPINPLLMTLGISRPAATLLLYLIEHGEQTVSSLAKKNSFSRTTTYSYLAELEQKNLCFKKAGSQYHEAAPISMIRQLIDGSLSSATENLDNLFLQVTNKHEIPIITVAQDKSAASDVYKDLALTLPKGGTFFRYTSRKSDFPRDSLYREARIKKDFERLVITSVQKAESKKHDPNRFIKTVPKDFSFDDDVSLIIYDNKIAHIDHTTGTAITITSKKLARFQEKIFKLLWRKL